MIYLGQPKAIVMCRITNNFRGHHLNNQNILYIDDYLAVTCSKGKLIVRSYPMKINIKSSTLLKRISVDIFRFIHPHCGPCSFASLGYLLKS